MNVSKININQTEPTYYIASDIYDVSAHNNDATFESLSTLLSDENLSTLIPSEIRCGGMTIRFIQSSDNKYVQYRLMASEWSLTESDWQGVDDEPTTGSNNLVYSGGVADKIKNILNNNNKESEFKDFSDRFLVTDYILNIAFKIDSEGIHEAKQNFYGDNGCTYVTDKNGNIAFSIDESGKTILYIKNSSFIDAFNRCKDSLDLPVSEIFKDDVTDRIKSEDDTNPISLIKDSSSLAAIFHHWGFLGDSLSSGCFVLYEGSTTRIGVDIGYSWTQRMMKLLGVDGVNWTQSGWTTKMWVETFWNNEEKGYLDGDRSNWGGQAWTHSGTKVKEDPKQAYVILFGANDGISPDSSEGYKHLDPGNVETDIYDASDPTTYSQNADTFAGWLGGIIQRLKTIAPSAKMFVMTVFPAFSDRSAYDAIIRQMPNLFTNVYLLDVKEFMVNNNLFNTQYWEGGHFRPNGYEYVARVIATYIDKIIREHPNDFKWVPFINTEVDEGNF